MFQDAIEELGLSDIAAEVGISGLTGQESQPIQVAAAMDVHLLTTPGCESRTGCHDMWCLTYDILESDRASKIEHEGSEAKSYSATMMSAVAGNASPSVDEHSAKKKRLQRAHGGKQASTLYSLDLGVVHRHGVRTLAPDIRCAQQGDKGLRHFSMKVCEKVEQKVRTTYNEVADELVAEFGVSRFFPVAFLWLTTCDTLLQPQLPPRKWYLLSTKHMTKRTYGGAPSK